MQRMREVIRGSLARSLRLLWDGPDRGGVARRVRDGPGGPLRGVTS